MGKRTRYQQDFLAQLILDVKRKEEAAVPEAETEATPAPTPLSFLPKVSSVRAHTHTPHNRLVVGQGGKYYAVLRTPTRG